MMTPDEVRDIAEEAAEAAVRRMLVSLGADAEDPIELQKDFAMLRAWRTSTEAVRSKVLLTIVTVIVTATLGWLAVVFKPAWWR